MCLYVCVYVPKWERIQVNKQITEVILPSPPVMNYCFPAPKSMVVAWELNIQSDRDLQHALLIPLSTGTANNKPLKQRKRCISFPSFHYHIFNWPGISFVFVRTNSAKSLLQIWTEEPGTMREKPRKSPCKWRFLLVEAQQGGGVGPVSAHPLFVLPAIRAVSSTATTSEALMQGRWWRGANADGSADLVRGNLRGKEIIIVRRVLKENTVARVHLEVQRSTVEWDRAWSMMNK